MSSYITKKTTGNTSWFTHDRFGMFIHFGLYSLPGRHEWVKCTERMTDEKYDKYFEYFDPDMLDMRDWARQAKAAGMKYAVITTKHHEGFCLFDSKYTDYKSTNTKYGRDIVADFVEAFRAEGIRIGFYYSLLDWHHPDFTIDKLHPQRGNINIAELNAGRDMKKYAKYMRDQLTELLTNYGKIDILWLDFCYETTPQDNVPGKGAEDWESERLIKTVRSLCPDIIINNRSGIDQDLWTPEQRQPSSWFKDEKTGELVVWEGCHTFSGSWGYHRDESKWKSPKILLKLLIESVAYGGNLIMNVGPTARGNFDYRAEAALKVYADWMKYNSKSIYGCTMAEPGLSTQNGCQLTQSSDGKRLYIFLFDYPFVTVRVDGIVDKVDYAHFLHDGSETPFRNNSDPTRPDSVLFTIPEVQPNSIIPVIEVFLK